VVVEDRVDLVEVHEVLDVDCAGLLGGEAVELLRRDHHVALGADLVALDEVLVRDLLAGARVHALLLDALVVLAVELVEAHGLARDRAEQLHGDVHQPEADGSAPNGARHSPESYPARAA